MHLYWRLFLHALLLSVCFGQCQIEQQSDVLLSGETRDCPTGFLLRSLGGQVSLDDMVINAPFVTISGSSVSVAASQLNNAANVTLHAENGDVRVLSSISSPVMQFFGDNVYLGSPSEVEQISLEGDELTVEASNLLNISRTDMGCPPVEEHCEVRTNHLIDCPGQRSTLRHVWSL